MLDVEVEAALLVKLKDLFDLGERHALGRGLTEAAVEQAVVAVFLIAAPLAAPLCR